MLTKPSLRSVDRVFRATVAVSVLVHVLGLWVIQQEWHVGRPPRVVRVRLMPVHAPVRLPSLAGVAPPQVGSYSPGARPGQLSAPGGPVPMGQGLPGQGVSLPPSPGLGPAVGAPLALQEFASGAKGAEPSLPRVEMVQPSAMGLPDSSLQPSMDLLRMVDLSRADRERSMVMVDPGSKRDLQGYVNFTRVKVAGAGAPRTPLDALARYLCDHTQLLARVRPGEVEYFVNDRLLKDPIIFLCQGEGFEVPGTERLTYFSPEEKALIKRYLEGGGFLFVEGSQRYLVEMAAHLHSILGDASGLVPVPVDHMLYHSFYEFGGGFPGENQKERFVASPLPWGWHLPADYAPDRAAADAAAAAAVLTPQQIVATAPQPELLGIWGVQFRGEMVGVLSDMGLASGWDSLFDVTSTITSANNGPLMAGTNVVVYALTRRGGLTPKVEPPRWVHQRPSAPLALRGEPRGDSPRRDDLEGGAADDPALPPPDELLADLDASLAVVQAPLGTPVGSGGLELTLDGRYVLEVLRPELSGVLLHNLPAGQHWLELTYGGKTKQLRLDLEGGKVQTVTFAIDRFAFLTQLRLGRDAEQIDVEQWLRRFAQVHVEEVHLGEDRALLEGGGGS